MNLKLKHLATRMWKVITVRKIIILIVSFLTMLLVANANTVMDSLTQLYIEVTKREERMNEASISATTHREGILNDQSVWIANATERDGLLMKVKTLEEMRAAGKDYQSIEDIFYLPEQSYRGALSEYPQATPTIKKFIATIVENERITITDICRRTSPSAHRACAAVDIRLKSLPDRQGAMEWLNSVDPLGIHCEIHRNLNINNEIGDAAAGGYMGSLNAGNVHLHCDDLWYLEQKEMRNKKLILSDVTVTTYNAEVGQTDSTPCVAGGTNMNICEMAAEGLRPIALSQDLVAWTGRGNFKAGDVVRLESTNHPDDWRCNGEFIVSDSMNVRYTKRADIFFMDRANNTSCRANITLLK